MGRGQTGTTAGTEASLSSVMGMALYGHAVGGKREPKPILSFKRNVLSPYRPLNIKWGKPTVRRVHGGAGKG